MKRVLIVTVLALAVASPASANVCAHDVAPAASLLFPFVAFDFNACPRPRVGESTVVSKTKRSMAGENTVISITNLSAEAQIVRVTLWTDLSMPVLDFNILFTGYDVVRFDMRDIFVHGRLPVTVIEWHTQREGVEDLGPVSGKNEINGDWTDGLLDDPHATWELLYIGNRCDPLETGYPGNYSTPIPEQARTLLRLFLTASQTTQRWVSDDCAAPYSGEYDWESVPDPWWEERDASSPTWMYLTADVVERCDLSDPSEQGYWISAGDGGPARLDNVLTGEMRWITNHGTSSIQAVHLEADSQLAEVTTTGNQGLPVSFYARYANLNDGVSDYREPLPTSWSFTYQGSGDPSVDTRVLLWKGSTRFLTPMDLEVRGDPLQPVELVASNCNAYTYYTWDEDANVPVGPRGIWGSADCRSIGYPVGEYRCANFFPLAVQEVSINQLMVVNTAGWMLFVWPASNYDVDDPTADPTPDYYQTWMAVRRVYSDGGETVHPATVLANYNCFPDQVLPQLGVNYDYVPGGGK